MNRLADFGVPLGDGKKSPVIQPQNGYAFRVMPIGIGSDAAQAFCAEVIKADLSLSKRSLSLIVRQNITPQGFDLVKSVVERAQAILVDYLSTSHRVNFSLLLHVQNIEHELTMDYTNSQYLAHRLSMTIQSIEVHPGDEAPTYDLPLVDTPVDEFISPERAMELLEEQKVAAQENKSVKKQNGKRKAEQS